MAFKIVLKHAFQIKDVVQFPYDIQDCVETCIPNQRYCSINYAFKIEFDCLSFNHAFKDKCLSIQIHSKTN